MASIGATANRPQRLAAHWRDQPDVITTDHHNPIGSGLEKALFRRVSGAKIFVLQSRSAWREVREASRCEPQINIAPVAYGASFSRILEALKSRLSIAFW